jgi:hypothetical protein
MEYLIESKGTNGSKNSNFFWGGGGRNDVPFGKNDVPFKTTRLKDPPPAQLKKDDSDDKDDDDDYEQSPVKYRTEV